MTEENKPLKKQEKEILELSGTLIFEKEEKLMCIAELKNKVIYLKHDENAHFGEIHINENSSLTCPHVYIEKEVDFQPLTYDDLLKNHNKKFVEKFDYKFQFTLFSPKTIFDGVEILDQKFNFYAMDEQQLIIWIKYIENSIKPKLDMDQMEIYSTIDQFGSFINFIQKLPHSKFLKVFNCMDVNYISDPMMYSLYIIFEYLQKDVVKLAKESIILEFESNTQTETIFRINSIYSKILTLIFKLFGQSYLEKQIKDIVQEIALENKKREIDPVKNPDQGSVDENAKFYNDTINKILQRLYSSVDDIPK